MGSDAVLVTGGAGFLGSAFVRLVHQERPVVVLDALTYAGRRDNVPDGVPFVHGDVREPVLGEVLDAHRVGLVVHFAAETHVDRSIAGPGRFVDVNVGGTAAVLEAVRARGIRLHVVSTDEVYGPIAIGAAQEGAPMRPSSPYAASKAAADLLVDAWHRTYGVDVVGTRATNCYGPRQFPEKLIPLAVLKLTRGEPVPIYGDGRQERDWLHADDHARAVWTVATKAPAGTWWNVAGRNPRANADVVARLIELVGSGTMQGVADRPAHDRRYCLDDAALRRLGWEPGVAFEDGLDQTVRWYRDHPEWVDGARRAWSEWIAAWYA